jgi:hypothetical protein
MVDDWAELKEMERRKAHALDGLDPDNLEATPA